MLVPYSPGEREVLSLLREDRGRTSAALTDLYYGMEWRPFNGQRVVVGLLSSLARKVVLNREPFRVRKSTRRGPLPIFFWKEPIGSSRRALAGQMDGTFLPLAGSQRERTSGRPRASL